MSGAGTSYFNPSGLYAQAQAESGGNYTAQSQTSSASGAYQFLTPTWLQYQNTANATYGTAWNYPTAGSAPPAIQDAVASVTPVSNWGGMWAGSGGAIANNPLYTQATPIDATQYVTANGLAGGNGLQLAGQPVAGEGYGGNGFNPNIGGGAPYNTPGDPNLGQDIAGGLGPGEPGYLPPAATGGPSALGLTPGLASGIGGWISGIQTSVGNWMTNFATAMFGSVTNWVERGFIIVVALGLVLIALWRLMDPQGTKTRAVLEAAA